MIWSELGHLPLGRVPSTGATTTNKSFSGDMILLGVVNKSIGKWETGGITPDGSFSRIIGFVRTVIGVITPSGIVFKEIKKLLGGSIALVGGIVNKFVHLFIGSIDLSGSFSKVINLGQSLTGGITFVGVVVKSITKSVVGEITPIGTFSQTIIRAFIGSIAPSGVFTKVLDYTRTYIGSIVPSSIVTKLVSKALSGEILLSGALSKLKAAFIFLTGNISPVGTFTKELNLVRIFTGAIASYGLLAKVANIVFIAVDKISSYRAPYSDIFPTKRPTVDDDEEVLLILSLFN